MPTPDIDKLDATGGVQPKADQNTPQEGKFSKLMQEEPQQASTAAAPSPLQPVPATPPTPETIQAQMATVSSSLGDIKNQLHTKGLHFKQSDKYRLRSHLSTANQQIRSAAEHLGATTTPPPSLSESNNPIEKFLRLVSDGQNQMQSAVNQLHHLANNKGEMNAGRLLLVQAKLQKASQELEYTSVILGKATDMIKTLFNVQI